MFAAPSTGLARRCTIREPSGASSTRFPERLPGRTVTATSLTGEASHAAVAGDSRAMAEGAYWLIGLGILGALVAAAWGLIDLTTIPRDTEAWRTGLTHMLLNTVVTVLFLGSFLIRLNDGYREIPSAWLIALSVVALVALSFSGWLGGRMSYRFGVRVASDQVQEEGFEGRRQQGGIRRGLTLRLPGCRPVGWQT